MSILDYLIVALSLVLYLGVSLAVPDRKAKR